MSRLVKGVVVVGLMVGLVVWFGSYRRYRDPVNGFSLSYPRTWFVEELKGDAATAPGVYFSAQKVDFNDPYALQTPNFVRVSVRPASE